MERAGFLGICIALLASPAAALVVAGVGEGRLERHGCAADVRIEFDVVSGFMAIAAEPSLWCNESWPYGWDACVENEAGELACRFGYEPAGHDQLSLVVSASGALAYVHHGDGTTNVTGQVMRVAT
jgi:hypothetical protein